MPALSHSAPLVQPAPLTDTDWTAWTDTEGLTQAAPAVLEITGSYTLHISDFRLQYDGILLISQRLNGDFIY